ncbi:MAG: hypothetical protein ACREKB_11395 [Candidatus Rokuibacteriota bacterium]
MARVLAATVVVLSLTLALGVPALALDWGGIEPGVTTIEQVRARYGAPSKESRAKVEGYDTIQWVYEDARAPGGIQRMTVDYGLLTAQGYKQTVVRVLRLEPKPKIFGMNTVIQGFGVPDGTSNQDGQDTYFYRLGLVVTFDKAGNEAVLLNFTLPQPEAPAARPAPASPSAPKR